jgi:hypothetical protein
VVSSKRDAIQHPFLEGMSKWAEGQRIYEFGSSLGKNIVFFINDINNIFVNPRDANSVIGFFIKGEQEFPDNFRENIINSMKTIGYELSKIGSTPNPNPLNPPFAAGTNGVILYAVEKNSTADILQPQMSQGMFRALSLLIHITYNIMKKEPVTILIDDIGEGLDFDRSSRLIKLLIEIAEK